MITSIPKFTSRNEISLWLFNLATIVGLIYFMQTNTHYKTPIIFFIGYCFLCIINALIGIGLLLFNKQFGKRFLVSALFLLLAFLPLLLIIASIQHDSYF